MPSRSNHNIQRGNNMITPFVVIEGPNCSGN